MTAARRILVLDADAGAALAIVQSLGRAGYHVTLAAIERGHRAFRSRYVADTCLYPDPLADKAAFQAWARGLTGHDLIIPPTERTLIPLSEIRDDPALAGRVALPPAAAVEVAFDKERVRALAAVLGIATPENLTVDEPAGLDHPTIDAWLAEGAVVLKSVRSKVWGDVGGGRELVVRMVTDRGQLHREADPLLASGPVQLQRWIPGHGVGIEMLVDHGEPVLTFAHERIHEVPLTGGGSSYRRAIDPPADLVDASTRLLGALDWHGVAMVEFRRDPRTGAAPLIELNGRFWGSLPLAVFAGVDFPLALTRLLLDHERPEPARGRRVYARQLGRDLDWLKAMTLVRVGDLRRRGPAPPERGLIIGRPLVRSVVEWARLLSGRETWDGAALDDPGPIARELVEVADRQTRAMRVRIEQRLAARRAVRAWRRPLGRVEKVLVLCSGNICRSAYAGVRLAEALGPRGIEVRSAGLVGPGGRPSHPPFAAAARARGVDLGGHRSHHAGDADLAWADLVLIMDQGHERRMAGMNGVRDKTRWLGALGGGPAAIPDPIDFDARGIEGVLDRLDDAIARLVSRLAAPSGP